MVIKPHALTSPVAIVDIGSNSVRLVVFESGERAALPVFNEKVLCGLGQDLDRTGLLPDVAIEHSIGTLKRFIQLAEEIGVSGIEMLATAAVREAGNGAEFVKLVRETCGYDVQVLSGEEEAQYAAYGLLSGIPDADGIVGDLGGGSVELVDVKYQRLSGQTTLPLGPIRFSSDERENPIQAVAQVDEALSSLDWLKNGRGRAFYAVGGAWRSVARLHMNQSDYPLHVIHNYTLPAAEASDFCEFVSSLSPETLGKVPGIGKKRLGTLAFAGMLMKRILLKVKPSHVVLSAFGLREGALYGRLNEEQRQEDPLIAACRRFAQFRHASAVDGDAMYAWLKSAFPNTSEADNRILQAACLLAEISRMEHPDYRAEHAFMRILRLPFVGLTHHERAFMALAVASRHAQVRGDTEAAQTIRALLDDDDIAKARVIGLALRLAYTLSGGIPTILDRFILRRVDDTLLLEIRDSETESLTGEVVERRLNVLCKAMGVRSSIQRV